MSHVNRTDRMSRRLLGLIGRCEAVETQNKSLAERVKALEGDLAALTNAHGLAIDQIRAEVAGIVARLVTTVEPDPDAFAAKQEQDVADQLDAQEREFETANAQREAGDGACLPEDI